MAKRENLEHKVVWITGASSGIGKALAKECALQGAQVILTARRYEELEKVRVSLLNPERHLSVCADITNESQVLHAYEQVLARKGRIDWLINNAGLSQRALIADTTMLNRTHHYGSGLFFSGLSRLKPSCRPFYSKNMVALFLYLVLQPYWVRNIARHILQRKVPFTCGRIVCVQK